MAANLTDASPLNPAFRRQWIDISDSWFYSATVNTDIFTIRLSTDRAEPGSTFATPAHISTVRTAIDRAFWLIEQSGFFPRHIHRNISIILSDSDLPGQHIFYDDDGVTFLIGQSIGTDRLVATLLNNMAMVVYEACDPNTFWSEFQAHQDVLTGNNGGFIPSPLTQPGDVVSTVATETQLGFITETLAARWLNQKLSPASLYWLEVLLPDLFNASQISGKRPTALSAELQARHWHSKNDLDQTLAWLRNEATPSTGNVTRSVPDNYFAFTPVAPLLRIDETITCPAFGEGYRTHVNGTEIAVRVYPQGDAAPSLRLVDITLDVKGYRSLGYKDPTQTLRRLVFDLEKLAGLFLHGGFNRQLLTFLHGLQIANDPGGPDHRIPLIKAESDRLFIDSDVTFTNDSQPLIRLGAADLSRHSGEALGHGLSSLLVPAWRKTLADNSVAVAGIEQLWGITGNRLEALQPHYGLDERYQARQWPPQSGDLYQRLVSGQRHNLRKRGGTAEDFVDAVRELYQGDGLAPALASVMEDWQASTETNRTAGEMADLLRAIETVYNEQPLRSEQWFFRRALDASLNWLTARDPSNPALTNLQRLKKNDEAQQDEYDGLAEPEQAPLLNNTSSVRGRFLTLKALGDWIGVYLTPDYLARSSHQTLASDLRQLVDASDLFKHRLNNTDELRMLSGNVTTPIRPDTLGDIYDHGLLKIPPDERNRTIPGEYVSLIIPGRNGAFPDSQSGLLTYLPTEHGMKNDTVHDFAPVNQTVNNGTFTLIPFDPDEGDLPYGSGWLAGHLSFFYQLGEALRLALGLTPEEDANAIKNRIRTELGLPRYYLEQDRPEQDKLPLPVVNPHQVIIKETLPVQVKFNQTTVTDTRKSIPLAVTGHGSLGRYLKLTAEPDRNGTYRLQLASIGTMTADDGLLPPSLWHRYPALTRPATGHRVRRSDSESASAPVAGSDFELMNKLIPDVITFYREFAPLLQYHRAMNADLHERFENLFRAFKIFDGYRRVNSPSSFALAVNVYEKLIALNESYLMKGKAGEKFAKLTTNFRRWLDGAIKPVPEKLHFVSIGPTVAELNNIRLWIAANSKSDLQINLWYDQNAMLATLLSEALKKAVTSQLTSQSGPGDPSTFESDLTKGFMKLQDQAWKSIASDMEQGRGFDLAVKNFLVGHLNYKSSDIDKKKAQMMKSYRAFKKKITSSYPGAKFSYKDINKVWTDAFGEKGKEAESYYLRELGLRGHQPAAIALAKTRVIGALGGVYSDTKLSPAINKDLFKDIDHSGLIKTDWARIRMAQIQLVIQKFGREFLPEDQDPAIEQKVSDDLVWFGEKYPRFKGDIERSLTNPDPSQLFEPLGKVKVIPSKIYMPKVAPTAFFAALPGSKTMQMVQNHLLTAYQTIDQYKLFDVTDWKTIEDTRTFFTRNQIAFPLLVRYRLGGISTFSDSDQILNGNNALEQSNSAMGWTGDHRDSLDIPELSSSEYYTISSQALAVSEHQNAIAVNTNTDPQSKSQYSQQLIIQMEPGDDSPIARASRYLFRKYNNLHNNLQLPERSYPSIRWLVIDKDAWSDGETGTKVNKVDIGRFLDSKSRIHVVGLGDSGNGEFTLSGQTALELSKKINELTADTPVKTINLVGSGIDDNGLVSDYLKEILKTTKTSAVTARDGLLRVDIWGRLWVGLVSETDPVTWSLADHSDKLEARRMSNGKITVERWSEKDTLAEGATGLRRLPSVLSQDSGLLGPTVNPDDLVPTLAMYRRRLQPGLLNVLKPDDLEALETKIAEFDQLRQEGSESALKKYMLVYRMQKNLPAILSGESAASHLAAAINQYLLDALVEVPEKLNFIWIGRLNEGVKDHLRVWVKMVPSWSQTLWYDPQAFLAPVLSREIYKAVADEKIAESFLMRGRANEEFLMRLCHLQELAYSTIKKGIAQGKTFDDMAKIFLVNHLGMDQEELTQIQRQSLQEFTDLARELTRLRGNPGSGRFALADINQLWQSGDEASMKEWYVKELGLRGVLAAAADLLRVLLLKEGGVYLDVDTLPHYNEKLFKGIELPDEILHSGRLSHLINHMIMDYFADPGPEQLFFNRTSDPEIRKEYNTIKERYPVFFKAVKEAIVNHKKEPLFTFPDSIKAIPDSIEITLEFKEKIHPNNNLIIAPPDSEVLKAVKREIIRRQKLIDRLIIGGTVKSSGDRIDVNTIERMAESIANELGIHNKVAKYLINYRGDGIVKRSGSTLHLSGPGLIIHVIRSYIADFLPEEDLFDYKLKSYFTQINPLARIDSVAFDTDERPSSWLTDTNKIARYKLTSERDSRYKNQIILQLGNSDNEARTSSYLRDKYQPDFSRLMRLMPDGSLIDQKAGYIIESRIVQASFITDDTRIIVVGHGSKVQDKKTGSDKFLLGEKTVEQLAEVIKRITDGRFVRTVSLVGCGADASGELYPVEAFARTLFAEILTERITVRNALVAVDMLGRKWTGTLPADGNVLWSQSDHRVKLVLEKDGRGQLMARRLPVAEGLVKKLHNLPALPPGRDYAYLGNNHRHFDQARRLLLDTMIGNNGMQKLSDLIQGYNLRLQQLTRDNFSPYRLLPLPAADAELPFAQAGAPRELQLSAFVRADSIGDPLSGVGLLAYGNPFAQENFFRTQQAGYLLARQVSSPPSDAMATLFTRLLLGSLQDIVAPGGHDIDPFRVSSPDLLVSVLGKDDLFALYAHQKVRNGFSELAQQYVKTLRELSGDFLAEKLAEKKSIKTERLEKA